VSFLTGDALVLNPKEDEGGKQRCNSASFLLISHFCL
jgi:hypothetical protein